MASCRKDRLRGTRASALRGCRNDGGDVIADTSYALGGDAEKARAAGCDADVSKPYSPRHLLGKSAR
jgi:CheY-like chemotaxis protein